MLRSYKYRLNPTKSQIRLMEMTFGCCRYVYNWALQTRIEAYQRDKKSISAVDLCKMLTELKKDKAFLYDVSNECLQQSIRNMDQAFVRFFREKNGFPKFKSKHRNRQSFKNINSVHVDLENSRIKLPKLGWVRFYANQTFNGKIGTVTVSKTPTGKYLVSILVDNGADLPSKPVIDPDKTVGIDVGIKDFAVLSNEDVYRNPKHLENSTVRLKVLQRRLARKQKGSARRNKARLAVASIHERIHNQRQDYLHKVSSKIVRENQTIVIEDLNISGMMKNHRLANSIASVSWSEFFRMLQYKSDWYGRNLIRIGRFDPSSRMCECGYIHRDLRLSDREWVCPECGAVNDRDLLAARNIKKFGLEKTNLIGQTKDISPVVNRVGDVEPSTLVGATKRQVISVQTGI